MSDTASPRSSSDPSPQYGPLGALVRAFEIQSAACAAFGSPFSAALLGQAAGEIEGDGPLSRLLAPWTGSSVRGLVSDAVPIRWLGALHDLALSGDAPALAAAYPAPTRPGDADAAFGAARAALETTPERIAAFMGHEPQTNEVRRSAGLLGGFLTVAKATGLPLRLFEIGASAGLNQRWDLYHYDLGAAGRWGDAASRVAMDTDWRGPPPPLDAPVRVVSRAACDRAPVDIRDALARRRLKAYVWADQFDRLARLESALEVALEADARVEAEDAVTWIPRRAAPQTGAASVIFHSIFWQYMPPESQAAATAAIEALGAQASAAAPLAWLRMEPPPESLADVRLTLTLWPGGEARQLARVHPHGAWVEWEGDA
jgi:hypothetical protein